MNISIEWLQLMARVMSDGIEPGNDVAYLVGETKDNALSVLTMGAVLLQDIVPAIAIQKGGDGFGYCGFAYSQTRLMDYGVPQEAIVPVEYRFEWGEKVIHTLTELITVARFAKQMEWKRLCLVAPAFHQLRSFLSMVTALDREYPELKVYNCMGTHLPWNEHVVHSQGALTGTRLDLIVAEIERIARYQQSGSPYPLVSVERALEYLKERDTR